MSPEVERFKQALRSHAERKTNAIALWGDQEKLDYATLYAEVMYRQQRLRDEGVRVVALALDNGTEAILWDLALLFEGLTCLTLPPFFSPAQRTHCLEQSQAGLVIAGLELEAELQAAGYEKTGEFWRRTFHGPSLLPEGTAKLTFTSGTTGTPKGVCLSGESILRVAHELDLASKPTDPRHHLALLPLAILLENLGCYAALYAGAMLSLPSQKTLGIQGASGVDVPRLLGCLAARAPESLILVPQLLLMLVSAAEQKAFNPQFLRFAAVGGARVSEALLHRAQRVGVPVYEGYGLSECASVVCLNQPAANRPGSVGRPLSHVQIRLAEDGEVLIKGSLLVGYLGDAPHANEWWPSGDLGEFDADGFLYLKGRKKHQFVTSFGRNVNPEWVEAELTQRQHIAQAFVYGEAMPSNHALLWPHRPDCTDEHLAAAVAQANEILPDYAQVHHWTRLDEPFTTANGLLTANGRPRRDAIALRYRTSLNEARLSEELPAMTFFDTLQEATQAQRQTLFNLPIIRDALEGKVSLDSYRAFLTEAYYHVRHTVPLMMACGARLPLRLEWLRKAVCEYIEDEYGHEQWVLNDIEACGGDKDAVLDGRPSLPIELMVSFLYDLIARDNPVGLFGMVNVLEGTSIALATHAAGSIRERLKLPESAFSYLGSHGSLDVEHMQTYRRLMNELTDPADQAAVIHASKVVYALYTDMFRGLPRDGETPHAPV